MDSPWNLAAILLSASIRASLDEYVAHVFIAKKTHFSLFSTGINELTIFQDIHVEDIEIRQFYELFTIGNNNYITIRFRTKGLNR